MGYMIQISESKAEKLKEHAYKSMKHLGKLYECIEELCDENSMGERDGGYMGYRDEESWEREPMMGFRRGVPGSGRGRYRN